MTVGYTESIMVLCQYCKKQRGQVFEIVRIRVLDGFNYYAICRACKSM